MGRVFTVDEARGLMPEVTARAREFVAHRAEFAELSKVMSVGDVTPRGGIPEMKALEARMYEILSWFASQGIEVKGWAPLLADFPAVLGGDDVLLCWLEGETTLAWYHRVELGFAGRRPLAELD